MSDFYTESQQTARKQHTCFWCNKKIDIGEEYIKAGGVFQGYFGFRKECMKCNGLIIDYTNESDYYDSSEGIDDDELTEFWREYRCRKCIYFNHDDGDCEFTDMTHRVRCESYDPGKEATNEG